MKAVLIKFRRINLLSRRIRLGLALAFCLLSFSLWHKALSANEPSADQLFNVTALRSFQDEVVLQSLREIPPTAAVWEPFSSWQEVLPQLYVYSAHHGTCPQPCLKVVAIVLSRHSILSTEGHCHVRNATGATWTVPLQVHVLQEHHQKCFRASLFFCILSELRQPTEITSYRIAFPSRAPSQPIQWLPVIPSPKLNSSQEVSLSVCVRPLFNQFSSPTMLSEFVGYYQALGVSHFVFYNQTMAAELGTYFSLLRHNASVSLSLRQWDLPLDSNAIHSEGQLAHIQDCLLFSRSFATHTLMVDLDEFVLPQEQSSLPTLVGELVRKQPHSGSFVVPNVMMCHEFLRRDAVQLPARGPALLILLAGLRQATSWPHHHRSKPVVALDRVVVGGIHFVWNHTAGNQEFLVPAGQASLLHLRSCRGMWQHSLLGLLPFRTQDDLQLPNFRLFTLAANLRNTSAIRLLSSLWNLLSANQRVL